MIIINDLLGNNSNFLVMSDLKVVKSSWKQLIVFLIIIINNFVGNNSNFFNI